MIQNKAKKPNVNLVLKDLKDFQRDTVNYVFRRLYTDTDQVTRFLVADEVGLGKTLVARGVIARVVEHLWNEVDRIDIVYICSNQDIAQQNIDRLNITQDRTFQHASRATLLPIRMQKLKQNKLNFVSLTPGTSFNLSSKTGWGWERLVLLNILRKAWDVPEGPLSNILRGDIRQDRWKEENKRFIENEKVDEQLEAAFIALLQTRSDLRKQYEELSDQIGARRIHMTQSMRINRNSFIGTLRRLLAKSSLTALEPDLVILDEFQRFRYLLDDDNEFALLAQELFNYQDVNGQRARVLLLSATPYKMYTLLWETDENHYTDFIHTAEFLLSGRKNEKEQLEKAIEGYRKAFLGWHLDPVQPNEMISAKEQIESILKKIMVRTERLAASADRNGMLKESCVAQDEMRPTDMAAYVWLDRIANRLEAGDQVEYWKSSPYPLNLMEEYKLKRKFINYISKSHDGEFISLLTSTKSNLILWDEIKNYKEIEPGNAKLRALFDQTINTGNWQLLWIPPSLPYYLPEGPFATIPHQGGTKTLIFSSWQVVPKAIAVLLSYEVERRMIRGGEVDFDYDEFTKKRPGLLRFSISRERKTGMSVFSLIYPCLTLARKIDPLEILKSGHSEKLFSSFFMLEHIKLKLRQLIGKAFTSVEAESGGPVDERWYWAAPLLLDRFYYRETITDWLNSNNNELSWRRMLKTGEDEDEESGFGDHLREFASYLSPKIRLGRPPDDLLDILARIALASPAVTALRSLMRVIDVREGSPAFLAAAAQAGLGFRTLFNQPETISFLQSHYADLPDEDRIYWKLVLRYCINGNLQAVIDEYMHVLRESHGLLNHHPDEAAIKLGSVLRQALSIRSPSFRLDEISIGDEIQIQEHRIRCRYGLRFGDEKSEEFEGGTRNTDVRIAFNSPFRPFVLATTSIGQEGLDFHQYCHRVVHWNLPANPVDLEQREGRVHRYKGHVVRRNLAEKFGLGPVKLNGKGLVDPWEQLFKLAKRMRQNGQNDLVPYWIFEGGNYKIERIIPVLPLSREIQRLEQLKKSLVAYRAVIGQPRQEELLNVLTQQLTNEEFKVIMDRFMVDLSPPPIQSIEL